MVGDTLFYNKKKGIMRAFNNIFYEDKVNKNILTGDYAQYNEITGEAYATQRALAKDFSNGKDTMFVHADTLRLHTFNIKTDSVYRVLHGYYHVRAFRTDVQAVADSMKYDSKEKCLSLYKNPIAWYNNQQILGEVIYAYMNDSTLDSVRIERQALLAEKQDSVHYNQVASRIMKSHFEHGKIKENEAEGNVMVIYYPYDSDSTRIGLNYTETARMRMFMKEGKMDKIWTPQATGTLYPMALIPKDKLYLENFAWFDYIRPKDKTDIFQWRGKKEGTELKEEPRREAPLQTLRKKKKK